MFEINVRQIVERVRSRWEGDRLAEILAEARAMACGECAHYVTDHRWTQPSDANCLLAGCECKAIPEIPDAEVNARWDAVVAAMAA